MLFQSLRVGACALLFTLPAVGAEPVVREVKDGLEIETDQLVAKINSKGYVSGVAAGSFLDKKTGARDLGFGLHIMDFLMAPGWRDDGYPRDKKVHGNLPKHYVEGPQICTQAKELKPEVIKGTDCVAVKLRYTFTKPGAGRSSARRTRPALARTTSRSSRRRCSRRSTTAWGSTWTRR